MTAAVFDDLRSRLAGQDTLDARVEVLLAGLAAKMAATSNDQNVQRLARELRAAAPLLKAAMLDKVPA